MSKIAVLDMQGKEVEQIELSDDIFGIKPNASLVHKMVVNYLANKRQGTQSALTRAEVSGGGRKPWRQKGTGHARQGSIRAPQWMHGGVVFAPKPRDYGFSVNKKERRLAMKSAFSDKALVGNIVVIDSINMEDFNTKIIVNMLKAIDAEKKPLIVLPESNVKITNSARNIPGVKTALVNTLNVYDIINANKLVIVKDAVKKIEEVYA